RCRMGGHYSAIIRLLGKRSQSVRRTRGGEPHLVIRRSTGASQLVPGRWTAVHTGQTKAVVAVALTPEPHDLHPAAARRENSARVREAIHHQAGPAQSGEF